jgi:hypothetical protein
VITLKPHSDCARRRAYTRVVAEIEHIDMNGSTQTARVDARRCSAERQKRRSNRDGFDLSVFFDAQLSSDARIRAYTRVKTV